MDKSIENILKQLPISVRELYLHNQHRNITELKIRVGFDIKICVDGKYIVAENSALTQNNIDKLLFNLCENTFSAYENQISKGFITLPGGHRVGLAGVYDNDVHGKVVLTRIQAMNIRLANFYNWTINSDIIHFNKGLLVAGAPHSGKTTFIKSLCSQLQHINIAVCDERNELYNEKMNNDFIINIPKHIAISQATRTLNPQVIICDEIGDEKEAKEILSSVNSGVRFICTVHSDTIDDLYKKPNISILLKADVFDKIILLENSDNSFYIKEVCNV